MSMTVHSLQRSFAAKENIADAAGEYKKSTKAIVIQAVVGLLTGGIGAIAIEIYHAANRASKRSDFKAFAGDFLKAAKDRGHNNEFKVPFKDAKITITEVDKDVTISYGGATTTIKGTNINELRKNLELDIVRNRYQYHQDTIRIAINNSENKVEVAKEFLQDIWANDFVSIDVFNRVAKDDIAELSLDVFNNPLDMERKFKEFQGEYKRICKEARDGEIRYVNGKLSIKSIALQEDKKAKENLVRSELPGFHNFNSTTCYANSALKFLFKTLGTQNLLNHLKDIKNDSANNSLNDGIDLFINLIEKSMSNSTTTLKHELKALFAWLQNQEIFKDFEIIGKQQDASIFIPKVINLFKLEAFGEQSLVQSMHKIVKYPNTDFYDYEGEITFNPELIITAKITTANMNLQDIVNSTNIISESNATRTVYDGSPVKVIITEKYKWETDDISKIKQVSFLINSVDYESNVKSDVHDNETSKTMDSVINYKKILLNSVDYESKVKLDVHDNKTSKTFELTLQPQVVVIHDGDSAESGHYYMYARQESGRGWVKHNDKTVTSVDQIDSKEQPKIISFAVVDRQVADMNLGKQEVISDHIGLVV